MEEGQVKNSITSRQKELVDKIGNNSVYTMFLAVDMDKSFFSSKASEHFFYTPIRSGQSLAGPPPVQAERSVIEEWLKSSLG